MGFARQNIRLFGVHLNTNRQSSRRLGLAGPSLNLPTILSWRHSEQTDRSQTPDTSFDYQPLRRRDRHVKHWKPRNPGLSIKSCFAMLHVPCMRRRGGKSGWLPLHTENGLAGDRRVRLELVQVASLSCFYHI